MSAASLGETESMGATLRLRPDPALAATARLFAAAVARRAGVGQERIDDLKLAVTEACAAAIDAGSAVEIDVAANDGRVAVVVRASRIGEDRASAPDAPIGRLDLIRALFDDVETSPGSISFSLSPT
ncbi:MAG: ATP-binding protein [Actinomycetota bacterium]